MSVTSKTAGNTNKCCDTINQDDVASGGSGGNGGGGNPNGTTVSRDYCFNSDGSVDCSWAGPTPGEAIANLFDNLADICKSQLANDIDNQIQQLVEARDNEIISNPNMQCPAGSCRQVKFNVEVGGNTENPGEFEVCCDDSGLAGGGGSGQGNGKSPNNPKINLQPIDFGSCS